MNNPPLPPTTPLLPTTNPNIREPQGFYENAGYISGLFVGHVAAGLVIGGTINSYTCSSGYLGKALLENSVSNVVPSFYCQNLLKSTLLGSVVSVGTHVLFDRIKAGVRSVLNTIRPEA